MATELFDEVPASASASVHAKRAKHALTDVGSPSPTKNKSSTSKSTRAKENAGAAPNPSVPKKKAVRVPKGKSGAASELGSAKQKASRPPKEKSRGVNKSGAAKKNSGGKGDQGRRKSAAREAKKARLFAEKPPP